MARLLIVASGGLSGLCHVAETKEQAYRDVEYGIEHWFRYFQQVAAFPRNGGGRQFGG